MSFLLNFNRVFQFSFRFLSPISVFLFISNSLFSVKALTLSHVVTAYLLFWLLFSSFTLLITTTKVHLCRRPCLKSSASSLLLPLGKTVSNQYGPPESWRPATHHVDSTQFHGPAWLPCLLVFALGLFLHFLPFPSLVP